MRVALVAVVALSALTASAYAALAPQRGMAGIELGMSRAEVRAELGKPLAAIRGRNEFGPFLEFRYPFLLRVIFQGNEQVTAIETRGRRERTASGVGVGSGLREVRRLVRGVRCDGGRDGHCFLGSFVPGRRVTDFFLRGGRVTRVIVGFVID